MRVSVKHSGKVYNDVELDATKPGSAFKQTVHELTGVPTDRMKVMIRGGMLKDDTDWNVVGIKEVGPNPSTLMLQFTAQWSITSHQKQVFTVIGTAEELPPPPPQPPVFLEDMDDSQLATTLDFPAGLKNLGNTCYLNATIQALRSVPELQAVLQSYNRTPTPNMPTQDVNATLTSSLRALYQGMAKSLEPFAPIAFLQVLRQANPQFAERGQVGFAQQDADECWSQILTSLQSAGLGGDRDWTSHYMAGEMETTLKCDDAPNEPTITTRERVLKLQCNISASTNYMHTGITDSWDQKITKYSPELGHEATYSQRSRLSRLPSVLTVQMVRFYWRRDINKKAKIMRKVKFPFNLDVLSEGMVTDDLERKLASVNKRQKEIEQERKERRKARGKLKGPPNTDGKPAVLGTVQTLVSEAAPANAPFGINFDTGPAAETHLAPLGGMDESTEESLHTRETNELLSLVDPSLQGDIGANVTGMYELSAIITHKGASADGGHYIAWVKRQQTSTENSISGESDWYKFDDDKVSVVTQEKITSLDGGGEDSTAYILLYRSKPLD